MPRSLDGAAEILAATGSDPLVRSQLRGTRDTGPAWAQDGAVGWFAIDADLAMRYFFVLGGTPAAAAWLVDDVAEEIFAILPTPRISVPRGTPAELTPAYRLEAETDWDFRWTRSAPAPAVGEALVQWLPPLAHDAAVAALLEVANPRTSAQPGDADVRRWAGVWGPGRRLDACAADTSGVPGVGHISAIAIRPECRGQGLGTAISAWLTRQLLSEFDLVTLGVYADNPTALRMYDRLGYAADHHCTSGVLARA